jgi:hypothetical protein
MQSDLNLRQRRWLELIKDYDVGINYHSGKANDVADAPSRKKHCNAKQTCEFSEDEHGTLWRGKCICVLDVKEIHELILREAHDFAYSIHLSCTKMYQDLETHFWWHGMKRDVAEYVALCDTCQRVKAEHQRPAGLLQPLKISEWK